MTGGSGGIGAAVCELAGRQGYSVAVNFAHDEAAARTVVDRVVRGGGKAVAIRADVSMQDEVAELFESAEQQLGPLSLLVNNAGITGPVSRFAAVPLEVVRRIFEVNVMGTVLCARQAILRMSSRHGGHGGAIVNVSSRAARLGGANAWVYYAMTKGAIESLTVGLAREVADEGIRVNAVAPGLIQTGIHAAAGDPSRIERMRASVPLGREGQPLEVAEAILWLGSPAASYVTGAVLEVSGGR